MGFLDNSTNNIIVDAVLTDYGRELLARNDGSFSVVKFAMGDDEVDYTIIRKFGRTVGKEKIEKNYINLDAILIRDVTLPLTLQAAIEQKLKQEQESLEYEFKIDKAKKEAERKEIEAKGIAEFQKIVNRTITPQLLKWKGVEATQEIAKSSNAKVIVIGNGDGDLPIILGGQ